MDTKFKVWSKKEGKWLDYRVMLPSGRVGRVVEHGEIVCDKDSDVVVVFWTGLLDKNGVEIYEGDLVKYGLDKPDEVLFENGRFTLSRSIVRFPICDDFSKDMEVTGNVYENSDLLTP